MKLVKLHILLHIILFFFIGNKLVAQTTLTGTVTDASNGDPLIGASIFIAATEEGTVTDFDGAFSLKSKLSLPITIEVSYVGYEPQELVITENPDKLKIKLEDIGVLIEADITVKGQRISEKQKAAPLTVESLDILAIKETPSDNFYDGLGSLKGVDLTAASLGFKIINTRGFNSTSPVRSLQIIDGVDNQAPGLNFSLGNFLGSSELDVLKVDLIVGASSAYYGPNAFNGVISMETKNPFYSKGLSASVKGGERNLVETALRYADVINNKNGDPLVGFKFNFSYLRADDWVADNYDPVDNTQTGLSNPGRFDAVNIYGDEYSRFMDLDQEAASFNGNQGLGQWHRTGYQEIDLVDYGTRNIKANGAVHIRTAPNRLDESPELILSSSYGYGTTVYQGDNRFSLRDIQFYQHRLEYRKQNKFFLRFYMTQDDAGNSYDPYFTALKLQERARPNDEWALRYSNFWKNNYPDRMTELGYPELEFLTDENGAPIFDENGVPIVTFDFEAAEQWKLDFQDTLTQWHTNAELHANRAGGGFGAFLEPGTPEFQQAFDEITSARSNEEGGTKFFDQSALYHGHGEYNFQETFIDEIKVGANARLYTPVSEGTIFYDTADVRITNFEYGVYAGGKHQFSNDKITVSATIRMDKNQNFRYLFSPAASVVYKPRPNHYLRLSFSSGLRNPTLTDQYLNLNVGPAILAGNLNGVDSLITLPSLIDFFDTQRRDTLEFFNIDPVRPEQVRTFEVGYRATLFNQLYLDASYYFNIYDNFLGFRLGADTEFNQFGFPIQPIVYRYAANSNNQVTTQGFSIGLNYYFWDFFGLNGNYSWNRLNKVFEDDPIIPAYNTPEHKFNIGFSGRDIDWHIGNMHLRNFGFNINYKWIEGFLFEGSPQFTGFIPTYDLLDAQFNFKVEKINTTFKFGASNILNNLQFQTYGGPRIGRLAYASILYEWSKK